MPDPSADPPPTVVPLVPARHGRPEPPDDMPPDQKQVWRDVVRSMPAYSFAPHNEHLLRLCCVHVVLAAGLADRVTRDVKFGPLLARATNTVSKLAKVLGLTPRRRQRTPRPRAVPPTRPWSA